MSPEKLHNYNGFFTMHHCPPFYNSEKDKEFLFNFQKKSEA